MIYQLIVLAHWHRLLHLDKTICQHNLALTLQDFLNQAVFSFLELAANHILEAQNVAYKQVQLGWLKRSNSKLYIINTIL